MFSAPSTTLLSVITAKKQHLCFPTKGTTTTKSGEYESTILEYKKYQENRTIDNTWLLI